MINRYVGVALLVACGSNAPEQAYTQRVTSFYPDGHEETTDSQVIGELLEEGSPSITEGPWDFVDTTEGADSSDIGTTEQAFSYPAGTRYGVSSLSGASSNRCPATWASPEICEVAQSKSHRFLDSLGPGGPGNGTVDPLLTINIDDAVVDAVGFWNGGAGVTMVSVFNGQDGTYLSEIRRENGNVCGDGALACAMMTFNTVFSSGGLRFSKNVRVGGNNGNAAGVGTWCTIHVDINTLATKLLGGTTLKSARSRYTRNLLRHELGHCVGLGHNVNSEVMISGGINPPASNNWFVHEATLEPTLESPGITSYVP